MPDRSSNESSEWCEAVARRQQHPRGPQRLADVLGQLLARKGYAQVQLTAELQTLWKNAVGERTAADSHAAKLSRGVLQILVRNSAVMQELGFRKRELLKRVQELWPGKVRDLRFRVGEIGEE